MKLTVATSLIYSDYWGIVFGVLRGPDYLTFWLGPMSIMVSW